MSTTDLLAALTDLREDLSRVRMPLALPEASAQADAASRIVDQLDDYVLPRLETIDAPLLTVVGGSTGAGKSTLVNSLVGRVVSRPGVIRPTTVSPVLVHHPDDAHWFSDDRILPGLIRATVASSDSSTLHLVAEPTLPRGLAILDAPDIDSVVQGNRDLAAQLLQAADLWLFVTSAARYADAVPWDFLVAAAERRASVAVVCDRVPPEAMAEVPAHLGQLMTARGLADSPLFAVPETRTDAEGLLPHSAVGPVRAYLGGLAADQRSRRAVVLQTLDGAIGSIGARVPMVARGLDDQVAALAQLREDARSSFREACRQVSVQSADGTLLRGEVLTRWHEFVGTGEFMRAMEAKISWLRDRIVGAVKGAPPEAEKVSVAVESGLEALVRAEAEAAAERAAAAWQANPAGRALVERGGAGLERVPEDFGVEVGRAVRGWQGDVMELVAGEGMDKRARARFLALGVNGVSVALMVVVFMHTGGLSGAEAGIAGGSAVVAQRLLEALFGDDAVRNLARTAKDALDARVEGLMAGQLERFEAVLDELGVDPDLAGRLREEAVALEESRTRTAMTTAPHLGGAAASPQALPGQGSDAAAGLPGTDGDSRHALPGREASDPVVDLDDLVATRGEVVGHRVERVRMNRTRDGGGEVLDAEIVDRDEER